MEASAILNKQEWSFAEFAELRGIAPATVRKMIERKALPAGYTVFEYSPRKKVIRREETAINITVDFANATAEAQSIALTRLRIIRLWQQKGDKLFNEYNNLAMYPALKLVVETIAEPTLYRWIHSYKNNGINGLLPKTTLKSATVTEIEIEILSRQYLNPNSPSIEETIRKSNPEIAKLGIELKSNRTYRRALESYIKNNAALVTYVRKGIKALNDSHLPDLTRDWSKIEAGDVIVIDGHTLDFTILNPATGKQQRMTLVLVTDGRSSMPLGWEIMPSENVWSVTMAIKRAVNTLGFAPRIAYLDNGKAFKSKALQGGWYGQDDLFKVEGLLSRIGTETVFAQAYHGQSKPVEKDFNIFAELERSFHTYTGNSVANKPARFKRNETAHRTAFSGVKTVITMQMAHEKIAEFFSDYATRIIKSGRFAGKTRFDNYRESLKNVVMQADYISRIPNAEVLADFMLLDSGRKLGKNGIKINNCRYWNDLFFNMEKGQILVARYDIIDNKSIRVYTANGKYICEAYRQDDLHPMALRLGTTEEVEAVSNRLEHRQKLIKNTKSAVKDLYFGFNSDESENMLLNRPEKRVKLRHLTGLKNPVIDLSLTPEEEEILRERSAANSF